MEVGTAAEPGILAWVESELGKLRRNQERSIPKLHIRAHLDAILVAEMLPVEAKTAGLFSPVGDDWGEPGTDEVPDHVTVQCHVQMMAIGNAGLAHVAALIGGRGLLRFTVPRNAQLCEAITDSARDFWRLVEADEPPVGVPTLDVIRRARWTPGTIATIDPVLVAQMQEAATTAQAAKNAADASRAAMIAAMGDAEAADWGGDMWFRRKTIEKAGYTVAPSTYTDFRLVKKPKER